MKHAVRFFVFVILLQTLNAQWAKTNLNNAYANCLTANGGSLYVGLLYTQALPQNSAGVFKSTDNGSNWIPCNTGLPNLTIQAIKIFNNTIFVGMEKGKIYKSTDDGASWALSNIGVDTTTYVMHFEKFDGKIFAGTNNKGVYVSTDNGDSWKQNNTNIVGLVVGALYTTETDLFAGVNNKNIYRYDAANLSWLKYSNGMPNNSVSAFAEIKDVQGSKYLFAGLSSSVSEVAVSTDNGANWAVKDNGLPNQVVYTMLGVGSDLFLGNYYGVYLSKDFGANWTEVSTGIGLGHPAYSLTLNGSDLFVIASGAVWKRPLSEMVTTSVEEISSNIPHKFELSQNYPNPFNPSTEIKFSLSKNGFTTLKIFDLIGREVATLMDQELSSGTYQVTFNAEKFASGIYIYGLQSGNHYETKRMMLVK